MPILLGYGRIAGIKPCPCGAAHAAVEQSGSDPLDLVFICWCGSRMPARADSIEEVERLAATRTVN